MNQSSNNSDNDRN